MKYALVYNDPSNDKYRTVHSIIVYDGIAQYTPEEGLSLEKVDDYTNIGDMVDI